MCFVLFSQVACKASDVKEVGDTYEVSGGNYKLVLDKKSGAIKSLTQDGKETTFSNADGVLWSATLRDGGKIDSSMLTCSVSERAGKLAFIYTGEDMDVQVTVSPRSKYVDFIATVTPKSRDILEFAVPARINFSPDAVSGISLQNNNPRNSGMTLNSSFFKNRSNMGMPVFKRGKMLGGGAYRKIFGGDCINLHPKSEITNVKVGPDAKKWLGDYWTKKLAAEKFEPSRPFGKGQADIVLAESDRGVFLGGSTLGGKGAIFRVGGKTYDRLHIARYWCAVIEHIRATNKAAKSPRRKIAILNFNTQGVDSEMGGWRNQFEIIKEKPVYISDNDSYVKALSDPEVMAIINPYKEFCPTINDKSMLEFADDIKKFVQDGGYWFECGGICFHNALERSDYLSVDGRVPAAQADFFHFDMKGAKVALYSVQPITWKEWTPEEYVLPSRFELGGSKEGGFIDRPFVVYVKAGDVAKLPPVRMSFGKDVIDSAQLFCRHNGVKKSLDEKLPKNIAKKFKDSLLIKVNARDLEETKRIVEFMPVPAVIHLSNYLLGGFDKQYPDHLPPRPEFGSAEDFKDFIKEVRARGSLFMPYTNNTWWCDNPRGPTFIANGEDPLSVDINGKHFYEKYAKNDGWTICMWHPAVRAANEKLAKEFTEDYPVDILFQDQCGARYARMDFNKAAPSPNSYAEGMISTVRSDSKLAPLSTEDGWWGICDYEVQFCGFSFGWVGSASWYRRMMWEEWPKDSFTLYNMCGAMFHDKLSLTHHDLGTSVDTQTKLVWTLAHGFSLIYIPSIGSERPQVKAWIYWLDALQKAAVSKYLGKDMTAFEHSWKSLDSTGDSVVKAKYGDISVVANVGEEELKLDDTTTLLDNSFYLEGKNVWAGGFREYKSEKGYRGYFLLEDKGNEYDIFIYAHPGYEVLFPVPEGLKTVLDANGNPVKFLVKDGVGRIKTPPAENVNYNLLLKYKGLKK